MRSIHRIAVLTATALLVLAAVVPLAGANGPMGGIEDVIMSVPAGGEGVATRAPMPSSSTTGTVSATAESDDPAFIHELTGVLSSAPTRGAKVVQCVYIYADLQAAAESGELDFSISEPSLQLLFLYTCIHVALTMDQQQKPAARLSSRAASGCTTAIAAPVHITKTASGYTATVSGAAKPGAKVKFRASCKRTSKTLQVTVRPLSRKLTLAKAIGPVLGMGFISKSTSPGKLKIALGVR